ncbi:MAG: NADAR family protein [Eubacteriales bacterium]|nr:NADAR family protein [Eubacteriales bacterium]
MQEIVCFHKPDEENGYLSNWYLSEFFVQGERFSSIKQYMVYQKALQFNDFSARDNILITNDAAAIKQIEREVRNCNERVWKGKSQLIVYQGLLSKFSQNDELKDKLLDTGSAMLAECSVSDRIWGIGISMKDDRRYLIDQWEGQNLLGFSLMQVRNILYETRSL